MEVRNKLPEVNEKVKKNITNLEKDSIQYNSQDLDQTQEMLVNPVQLNTQNLHIHVSDDKKDYSGKIMGIAYLEENKEIAPNVSISLFFGNESGTPVYKTNSDGNGNFVIEKIPPGYYTLLAELGDEMKYQLHFIKVLPGQEVELSASLKRKPFIEL